MRISTSQQRSSTVSNLSILAAILPFASARFITDNWPWRNTTGLRGDEYPDWNRNPNATASIPVAGWDLTKPYPGLWDGGDQPPSGDGWTLQLNVTANVTRPARPGSVTRISTQLRPPLGSIFDAKSGNWSVPKDISDTWKIYLFTFDQQMSAPNTSADSVNQGGDPQKSCEGFLSLQCMKNMRKLAQEKVMLIAAGDQSFIQDVFEAKDCPEWGILNAREVHLNNSFTERTSTSFQEPVLSYRYYVDAYDYYGSRMHASMIVWSYSNVTSDGHFIVGRDSLADDHVTFMCARANQTVGDSRLPGEEFGSSGARRGAVMPSLGMLFVVGLGVAMEAML